MTDQVKTPVDIFEEAAKRAIDQFKAIAVDEFFWHKLIACRQDLLVAFQQQNLMLPQDKVKNHQKIADLQLIAMKIGMPC